MRILYVNHGLGTQCGVYDFGKRQFNQLATSSLFESFYEECNSAVEYAEAYSRHQPDIVFFNYMPIVMPWMSAEAVAHLPAKRIVVQHLFDPTTVVGIMNSYVGIFDYMICNDPTLSVSDKRIFPVARTIQKHEFQSNETNRDEIRIGSFGFGLPHKNFHLIMREINKHFDNAVFNLHMTVGSFTGDHTESLIKAIRAEITKPNIRLNHTHDYRSEQEIIEMLASNDINALFYEMHPSNAGISSSADYLLASGKPMLLTDCALFKHIDSRVPRYPKNNFKTIMDDYGKYSQNAITTRDNYANKFVTDIENMIKEIL
jgi:hypothetical protein